SRLTSLFLAGAGWLLVFLYAVPLIWMAVVSLKPRDQAAAPGVSPLPRFADPAAPDQPLSPASAAYWKSLASQATHNYSDVWYSPVADFPVYLRNSTIIALLGVVGIVLSSSVVAYGFSRLRWRGRDAVFLLVLATLMIPQAVIIAPQYIVFKKLHLIGTFAPLWLPAWFGGAFSIFLLRQFFLGIPRELDEAATIDGCSHLGIFWRIILPLSQPALIAVALFFFIGSWNDFLGPLVFLNHQSQYTLQLGLQMYHSQHGGTPWNLVMAASILTLAPVLLLYLFARRFFVEGIATHGSRE
ncbi:MAG: carbohydrate ABC transporter permease, partial [Phycisphaerales bacterium]